METKSTVLIVDDDEGILETMTDILREKNFKVTVANDGYKAIEMIRRGMFNVILMDIRMPGINGVETFKRIKKIRAVSIFIFISAYAADELVIDALKEGATGIIFKPVDFNVLEKLMRDTKNNTPQKCQQYT